MGVPAASGVAAAGLPAVQFVQVSWDAGPVLVCSILFSVKCAISLQDTTRAVLQKAVSAMCFSCGTTRGICSGSSLCQWFLVFNKALLNQIVCD